LPAIYSRLPCQIDHIIAEKHRGRTVSENLAYACFSCNNHKGPNIAGLDPVTGELVALFNPRQNRWHEHFRWRGPELVGRTAIGRATIIVLEINLPDRVALRRALMEEEVFF
jgi:hypothetical protein